jgi:hypothetical protein
VTGLYWLTTTDALSASSSATVKVICNVGDAVYGGGAWVEGADGLQAVSESAPSGDLRGWYAEADNQDPAKSYTLHAYALCGPSGVTISNR